MRVFVGQKGCDKKKLVLQVLQTRTMDVTVSALREYVADSLTCAICHGTVDDPVQLTCQGQHMFCFSCMCNYFRARRLTLISCPSCRHGNGAMFLSKHVGALVALAATDETDGGEEAEAGEDQGAGEGSREGDTDEEQKTRTADYLHFHYLMKRRFPRQFQDSEGSAVILSDQMALFVHNLDHMRALEAGGNGPGWRNKSGQVLRLRRHTRNRSLVRHSDSESDPSPTEEDSPDDNDSDWVEDNPSTEDETSALAELSGLVERFIGRMDRLNTSSQDGGSAGAAVVSPESTHWASLADTPLVDTGPASTGAISDTGDFISRVRQRMEHPSVIYFPPPGRAPPLPPSSLPLRVLSPGVTTLRDRTGGDERARREGDTENIPPMRYNLRPNRSTLGYVLYICIMTSPQTSEPGFRHSLTAKQSRSAALSLVASNLGRLTHALVVGVTEHGDQADPLYHTGLRVTGDRVLAARTTQMVEVPRADFRSVADYIVSCYPRPMDVIHSLEGKIDRFISH